MTNRKSSRRSVLKSTAVGAAALAGTGLAGASGRFDHERQYEKAIQARDNAQENGIQTFRNVLRNTPEFDVYTNDVTKTAVYPSDDVSTDRVTKDDVDIWMTETVYSDYVYADAQFEVEYTLNDGDQPLDVGAVGWDEAEYDYDSYHYSSDYVDYGQFSINGVQFDYRDEDDDCHCRKTDRYFGCRALKEGGSASTRRIIGSLWHTYNNTTIQDSGITEGGVVYVDLADNSNSWSDPIEADIYESEA